MELLRSLRRRIGRARRECPRCGAELGRRELACPTGCGYDRRSEIVTGGSRWERLDRR